jgi:hypothetical protein
MKDIIKEISLNTYYNSNIQIHLEVIQDVFANITSNSKMLVFGLGYDSKMWYEATSKNTFFVENNDLYIQLNKDISSNNIIKYDYKTTCSESTTLSNDIIHSFKIPEKLLNEAPFDIIIIDGPEGWGPTTPGRLIPCYWSTMLSKPGTIIYVDDSSRALENFCVQKYFKDYSKQVFTERESCTKIYM